MCGLFGHCFKGTLENPQRSRDALHTLTHRGPDQWSESIEAGAYLGHRRLSILDLSESGRQPMISDDGKVAITVNGEIYNYKSLRIELGEGRFKSASDSEVVLHGYQRWGLDKLLEKIDGMYAIVIHDRATKKIHLARDRCGIKPLYYSMLSGDLAWGSELKALVKFYRGTHALKQCTEALYDFLTYRYIPAPKTLYRNVFKLEAASVLTYNQETGDIHTRRYWDIPLGQPQHQNLKDLIGQSVEEQMVADVPLGFFLSGGIDSSIIVAEAAQRHKKLHSFSIGYDVESHDETHYAAMVAEQFQTIHQKKILSADDNEDLLGLIKGWYDEPFADTSALPTYHVCKLARQHVTVALSGDGGDELFGGYRWYNRHPRFRKLQSPLSPFIKAGPEFSFSKNFNPKTWKYLNRLDLYSHFDSHALYGLMLGGISRSAKAHYKNFLEIPRDYDDYWLFKKYDKPELGPRKRLQYIDFHTFLPDDILTKVDRVSMAVSLEVRPPFLSKTLIEHAFNMPERALYHNGWLKGCLKDAYKDTLPQTILHRPKKGFSIPQHVWMEKDLQEQGSIEEIILKSFVPEAKDIHS